MIFLPWFGELTCQHESAGLRRFSSDEVLRLSREIHPLRFPRLEGGPFFHQPPVPWIEPLALFGPANASSAGQKQASLGSGLSCRNRERKFGIITISRPLPNAAKIFPFTLSPYGEISIFEFPFSLFRLPFTIFPSSYRQLQAVKGQRFSTLPRDWHSPRHYG